MALPEATLQAILKRQDQLLIIGDPVATIEKEAELSVATLNVQMPLRYFRFNKYLDLVYRTLEETSTETCLIVVEITLHEPLSWGEA